MTVAYLVAGVRTPIGRYARRAGRRAPRRPGRARDPRAGRPPPVGGLGAVDDVVLGCANQAGEDNRNVARMAALLAGLPEEVPGSTVNRLCGSGLDALATAARADRRRGGRPGDRRRGGEHEPGAVRHAEGRPRRSPASPRCTTPHIGWRFVNPLMRAAVRHRLDAGDGGERGRRVRRRRADQDAFALRSQQRAAKAQADGRFAEEIVPVTFPQAAGRPGAGRASTSTRGRPRWRSWPRCPPPFRDGGTVTAGNASGVNDGAVALLVACEAAVERYGLTPLARIVGAAAAGVPPRIMGIGPVPATRKLLDRAGLELGRHRRDRAQRGVRRAVPGGAAGAGAARRRRARQPERRRHRARPPARDASGARLALTAALELRRRGGRRALATMCIGVGQGISLLLESAP